MNESYLLLAMAFLSLLVSLGYLVTKDDKKGIAFVMIVQVIAAISYVVISSQAQSLDLSLWVSGVISLLGTGYSTISALFLLLRSILRSMNNKVFFAFVGVFFVPGFVGFIVHYFSDGVVLTTLSVFASFILYLSFVVERVREKSPFVSRMSEEQIAEMNQHFEEREKNLEKLRREDNDEWQDGVMGIPTSKYYFLLNK
jgi:ABC-type multidrug transport system fused ATPase/permease subunit